MPRGPLESMQNYKRRVEQERMLQEVVAAETLEDVKILLLSWIDDGSIQRRIPPPWEK
jgi:hypothetical protein